MNPRRTLIVTSLVSIVLFTVHWADDVVRGIAPGGVSAVVGLLILVVWLYAVLVLPERRSGLVLLLLGSLLGSGVPILHMTGGGLVGGRIAHSSGVFLWVWTLLALGATAMLSFLLCVRELWALRPRAAR